MADPDWHDVDDYIANRLIGDDPALAAALEANTRAGLPPIDVSPAQGRFLQLLTRSTGARRVLEVGTLGGYSTIELARGVGAGGRVTTLEIDPRHAEVARANVARAGLGDRVDLRIGPAADTLAAMLKSGEGPFDLTFIDADKPNNPVYFDHAVRMSRAGGVIIIDNVVREGRIADATCKDAAVRGTRAVFDAIAGNPDIEATTLQTVGAKGWDGFIMAVVG